MAYRCCNPFDLPGHSNCRKQLRNVQEWMIMKSPNISIGSKICDNCRKKLSKVTSSPPSPNITPESESELYLDKEELTATLNLCLKQIGETPYSRTKSSRKKNYYMIN